jgi:pimeloyl-ACP methyl ester carboxylesterase
MDMGAQPALVFAARHPDRTRSLVAMNCLAYWDVETSWEIAVLRRFGWNQVILRRFPTATFRRAEKTFLPAGQPLSTELRADLWESFKRKEVRDFIVRMCGISGDAAAASRSYRQITSPTLVLWGERASTSLGTRRTASCGHSGIAAQGHFGRRTLDGFVYGRQSGGRDSRILRRLTYCQSFANLGGWTFGAARLSNRPTQEITRLGRRIYPRWH